MTSRELVKQGDRPLSIEIGPTASQQDEIEYRNNEVAKLQEKVEELTRRLAQTEALETFRDLLSLDCPRELTRKTTILECTAYRERRECIKRNCLPRTMLLAKINL